MKRDKYIGMDVHQATTVVSVLDGAAKVILETILVTEAAAILRFLEGLSGPLHIVFEETTQAAWLYEVTRGKAQEVIVCDPRRNKLLGEGSKADKADARKLAELLRVGMLRSVYHGHEGTRALKELVRAYATLSQDTIRTMSRIKALFRGRGIRTRGQGVYQSRRRQQFLDQLRDSGLRQRAALLYEQLDHLRQLRRQAKHAMLSESRKHRAVTLLRTIPQLGAVRSAEIVAIVDTPHRFRTKRQFWSYSGLAVMTSTSGEYDMEGGRLVRTKKPVSTRGLNRNCNRRLKNIFIGAATAAAGTQVYRSYIDDLKQSGMRAEMARLTLARKIATVALMVWKKGDAFDPKKLKSAT